MTSLVEALRPRVVRIAASVARAMHESGAYRGGLWDTYHPNEGLNGTLYSDDAILWRRPQTFSGTEKCVIYTTGIRALGLGDQQFGETNITNGGHVDSHYGGSVEVPEGAVYEDTLSYTWNKLTTREDAYTQGLKIAVEEWVRGGAGSVSDGLAVGVNATQEFTAEFNQKYGSQQSESTTFTRDVKLTEPGVYSINYTRKSGDAEQHVTASGDYEFAIKFVDEHQVAYDRNPFLEAFGWKPPTRNLVEFGFASMAELLSVMRREAPNTVALYEAYMNYPESPDAIAAIAKAPGDASFTLRFKDDISYDVAIQKMVKAGG